MKIRIILIPLIVVLILGVIFYFLGVFKPAQLTVQENLLQNDEFRDFQLRAQAMLKADETICYGIVSVDKKNQCYTDMAKIKQNKDLCENIDDSNAKQQCYSDYDTFENEVANWELLNEARISRDNTLCNNLPLEQKSECNIIVDHAKVIHEKYGENLPQCESENRTNYRHQCYQERAGTAKDPELCLDILPGQHRDSCYNSLAQLLNDLEICRSIVDKMPQQFCLFFVAQANNQISQELCDEIENFDLNPIKDRCLQLLTA